MLRGVFALLSAILVAVPSLVGQVSVQIRPEVIRTGDAITVAYDATQPGSPLANEPSIEAEFLLVRSVVMPELVPVKLMNANGRWTGTTSIPDSTVVLFQLRFTGGGKMDDNGGNTWIRTLVDRSGNALRGANAALGNILLNGSVPGFKVKPDPDAAKQALETEAKRYPDDWRIVPSYWGILMRGTPSDEARMYVEKDLRRMWAANRTNDEAASALVTWFTRVGKKEEGDSLRTALLAAFPKGVLAERGRLMAVYQERDAGKRADLLANFLTEFPPKPEAAGPMRAQLAAFYLSAGRYTEGMTRASAITTPDTYLEMMLNDAAWTLAEAGKSLDTAILLAERSIAMCRRNDSAGKPKYMSQGEWDRSQERNLGLVLDTYGYALVKVNRSIEAQPAYAEAVRLLDRKEVEVDERYAECLLANGATQLCLEHCSACIRTGLTSEKLIANYKAAYVKLHGNEKGFDALLAKDTAGGKKEAEQQSLAAMMNTPAVPFTLKDMAGRTVKLQDLKGKVVVVDFWATWCGPCKASFPFLQKVQEKYRKNPNVVILALNTWEKTKGKEREETVKKFIGENKYTFRVVFDEDVVTRYGVEGIPTKFVIDKAGIIRFKTIGFDNGPQMISELSTEIDLLLKDAAPPLK